MPQEKTLEGEAQSSDGKKSRADYLKQITRLRKAEADAQVEVVRRGKVIERLVKIVNTWQDCLPKELLRQIEADDTIQFYIAECTKKSKR